MPVYRLTPLAESDLQDIFDYTVQQWGLVQALRYTRKVESACEALARAPGLGRDCADVHADYRRYNVERHIIYFRPAAYGVAVIRILHGSMDPLRRL